MDEDTRQAITEIADLIQAKLEDEFADRTHICEDAVARLDMLTGIEPRARLVWDSKFGLRP